MNAGLPSVVSWATTNNALNLSFILLVYDYALTFQTEVQKIWPEPRSTLAVLFWLNRFSGPLPYISHLLGQRLGITQWRYLGKLPPALSLVSMTIAHTPLILRCSALFPPWMWILLPPLVGVLFLQAGVMAIALGLSPTAVSPVMGGYWMDVHFSVAAIFRVFPLVTCLILFCITSWKTWVEWHALDITRPKTDCLRYGILYFLLILLAELLNVVLFLVLPEASQTLGASPAALITSMVVSRLLLDLPPIVKKTHVPDEERAQVEAGPRSKGLPRQRAAVVFMRHLGERLDDHFQNTHDTEERQEVVPNPTAVRSQTPSKDQLSHSQHQSIASISSVLPRLLRLGTRSKERLAAHQIETPRVLPIQPVVNPLLPEQVKRSRYSLMLERTIIVSAAIIE